METPAPYHPNEQQFQEALKRLAQTTNRPNEWWVEKINELRLIPSSERVLSLTTLLCIETIRAIGFSITTPKQLAHDLAVVIGKPQMEIVLEGALLKVEEMWRGMPKWN